jgi:transcriptional regulator with XRE-family HTH domain
MKSELTQPVSPGRSELAEFLRTRRARVQPVDVGLPNGERRRTPGLRREEVAQLADVGVSWYTWLEQGRNIHVSEPLLERLARALRLTPTERAHLFELAHGRPAPRPAEPARVSAALQRLLDSHPYPALVATPRWDVVAWNTAASILYGDLGKRSDKERNHLWSMFMNPERRARIPEWERTARGNVADFRLEAARSPDRTEFDALIAELLCVSAEFARLWNDHELVETPQGLKVFVHPELGPIEFEHVTLAYSEPNARPLRVTLYTPRPGESSVRARALFGVTPPI